MKPDVLSTNQKAVSVNLDVSKYGTFAEIGAGQEVARWFFHVGGASGTIAKTISAYDMTVSDAIYGPTPRYVSRKRLQSMLEYEFHLLRQRLEDSRGSTTRFFAFANTVAARSFSRDEDGHGWMGIQFQAEPGAEPSEVIIHVRMLDHHNVQQQEALGILGVNLIYGAFNEYREPVNFLESLLDNLTNERVEVDMIKLSGPAFADVDNRLMSLELVRLGLANAALFTADGEVVQASEILHKKAILVERGSFRPITTATLDMLECAQAQFIQEPQVQGEELVVLMEMTLRNLTEDGEISRRDFLDRVDLLGTVGKTVLISNYGRYYRLADYLFRYTKKRIGLAMGMPTLREIFEEKYYADLEGGILESFGRLFKNALKLYVYPYKDPETGTVITASNLQVAPNLSHLYAHLIENLKIEDLRGFNPDCLPVFSRNVLTAMRQGDDRWQTMVPPTVAMLIKKRSLFGCK